MKNHPHNIEEMYDELNQHIDLTTKDIARKKISFANDIERFGEDYISDVKIKEHKKEKERQEKIKYIVKYSNDQFGDKDYLMNTPLEDIESIYIQVKELRKPWYKAFFEFIMGWENNEQ